MKGIAILSVLLFAGATLALPAERSPRWSLVPDGEGRLHMVDLVAAEQEPEPTFTPSTDVWYILFTRRNPTAGQRIFATTGSLTASQWLSTAPGTRFIVHGWNQDAGSGMNAEIRTTLLAQANHNVVVVDWGIGAGTINYVTARNRVDMTGAAIASFIDFAHLNGFIPSFATVNVIGHSLGGHVAGFVGKRVTRGRIQTIFATDPAGPLFFIGTPGTRLDAGDAIYTESIYTDAGGLGFDQPIAHGNYYPNWGTSQPGCITGACNHARSNSFYAESVTSARFVARRCTNYNSIVNRNCPVGQGTVVMGGDASKPAASHGVFFVATNSNSPFAQG